MKRVSFVYEIRTIVAITTGRIIAKKRERERDGKRKKKTKRGRERKQAKSKGLICKVDELYAKGLLLPIHSLHSRASHRSYHCAWVHPLAIHALPYFLSLFSSFFLVLFFFDFFYLFILQLVSYENVGQRKRKKFNKAARSSSFSSRSGKLLGE